MENINSFTVGAAPRAVNHPPLKPEWLRIPDAIRVSGISRSSLYEMIASQAVRSTSLKKPGTSRGIRLVSYASLMAYIENSANAQNPCTNGREK